MNEFESLIRELNFDSALIYFSMCLFSSIYDDYNFKLSAKKLLNHNPFSHADAKRMLRILEEESIIRVGPESNDFYFSGEFVYMHRKPTLF